MATNIDPNSDPALSYAGPVIPAAISSGNITINITEEITKVENFNTNIEYNNSAGGANGTVQFNINGNLTGDSGLTYNYQIRTLTVSNSVIAGNFSGNASGLYNIPSANITGTVANANFSAYAGNITVGSQPNITGVGTLTDVAVSGNAVVGALLTNQIQYANGEPWVFDLGTANTGFDGDYIYNNSNNTMILSPSYNQDANATITIPNDSDANSNPLTIVNDAAAGVVRITANGNDWNFNDDASLTVPGNIVSANAELAIATNSANSINIYTNEWSGNGVAVALNHDANVSIGTDNGNFLWSFDNTGNLTLPEDNPTIIGGGIAGIDGSGTINLVPDSSLMASDQFLVVDPTGPNHIHLRAGGTGDASVADLILGAENTKVTVSDTSQSVIITTVDGLGNTFDATFANSGLVTLPKNLSVIGDTTGGNISVSGNISSNNFNGGNVSLIGDITTDNISATGNVNAGYLYGDASNVTNVPSQTGNFVFSGSTISVSDKGNAIVITGATANATNLDAQPITLQGTAGFDTGNGSNLTIVAGDTGANAGGIGGFVLVQGGYGYDTNDGGAITIEAGDADTSGNGGDTVLAAGSSSTGGGGNVEINSGAGDTGGNVLIQASTGATTNGVVQVLTNGTSTFEFNGSILELPTSSTPYIQVEDQYPSILAYGANSHGGPELNWMDQSDPANNFSDANTIRNTMYLHGPGLYVGFNENGNATPTFTGNLTFDATDGSFNLPANLTLVGDANVGSLTVGAVSIGSGNITGANVISANTFSGNIGGGSNVNADVVTANFFSGDGSNITGITVSTIGNITGTGANLSVNGALDLVILGASGNTITSMSDAHAFMMYNSNIANVGAVTDQYYGFKANTQGALVYINDGANTAAYQWTFDVDGSLALATPGLIKNGNSNIAIVGNGNIAFSSYGVSNVVIITDTGANIDGYANITDDASVGGNVTVTGNVTGANFIGVLTNGNSNVAITANGNITLTATSNSTVIITDAGANVTGYVDATYFVGDGANLTNISVTLANLDNGNSNVVVTANGNVTITSVSNATMTITDTGANVTGYVDATYFVGDGGNITGLTVTGIANGNSDMSVALDSDIVLTANGNATITVTETGANVIGYVDATYFVGDGANLTGIALSILDNGNSNVVVNLDSDIQLSSNGNLTMSITDTGANVTGYVDATYFVGDGANLTGITLANLDNGNSNVVVTANANITFTSSSNATMTITDTGANVTGYANITGNVTVGNLIGPVASGNSNIAITANGNITLTATSNNTMIVTDTGANITGYANITANANVGNLGTGGIISATGNITGATVTATVAHQLPVYANATVRDAAVTSPAAGMLVWNTADGNVQVYTGAAWGNLQPI
jgi:hypothetical protein